MLNKNMNSFLLTQNSSVFHHEVHVLPELNPHPLCCKHHSL